MDLDLSDVKGQHGARRALEIAAAGSHNLLMMGPPGGGKTMLARRIPSILPPLTREEALEVTAVHSVAGLQPGMKLLCVRPFRAPHHTVSDAGLVGGGSPPRPGEVSLAHNGVLFLDELAEFRRSAIEALRQPLEDGVLTIARARVRSTFPARPLLVAAVNPCPCGYAGDPSRRCQCGEHRIQAYRSKLSKMLDLFEIHINVYPIKNKMTQGDNSACIRERVTRAIEFKQDRLYGKYSQNVHPHPYPEDALLSPKEFIADNKLSARDYATALRIARTIADLDGSVDICYKNLMEAKGLVKC